MKHTIRIIYANMLVALLFITGCLNPLDDLSRPEISGKGNVRVQIGPDTGARTLFPDMSQFERYRLEFIRNEIVERTDTLTQWQATLDVALEPGNWTIKATGLVGNPAQDAVWGSENIIVESKKNIKVNIMLTESIEKFPGVFKYSIAFPELDGQGLQGYQTAHIIMSPSSNTGNNSGTVTIDLKERVNVKSDGGFYSYNGELELPAGQYVMLINLKSARQVNGRNLGASQMEYVYIYPRMTTRTPNYRFEEKDFTTDLFFSGMVRVNSQLTGGTYRPIGMEVALGNSTPEVWYEEVLPLAVSKKINVDGSWEARIDSYAVSNFGNVVNNTNLYFRFIIEGDTRRVLSPWEAVQINRVSPIELNATIYNADAIDSISVKLNKTLSLLMGETGEAFKKNDILVRNIYPDGSSELTSDYTIEGNTFRAGTTSMSVVSTVNTSKRASFSVSVMPELMDTGLPVIYIETQNAAPIVSKETWVNTKVKIVSDNPQYCVEKTDFRDQIRGRGNSTWSYPKKPYRIRFREDTSLFGLTAARNWVLLANWKDATLLNATVAFELGRRFDFPFVNNVVHVDVVLNGEYQGSYVLTEHMRVGAGRVEIDPVTDWHVELDTYYDEDPKFRTTKLNLPIMILSPDYGSNVDDPRYDFVRNSFNEFDTILSDTNFPDNNYKDILDIDNFVDFIMINEIVRNRELGHPKSTYMHKRVSEKIKMGHLWDFDYAFGMDGSTSINLSTAASRYTGGWIFNRFFKDPVFVGKYKVRWNEKFSETQSMSTFITKMYDELKVSQSLDNRRWGRGFNYEEEVGKLKTWWDRRVIYLNTEINK